MSVDGALGKSRSWSEGDIPEVGKKTQRTATLVSALQPESVLVVSDHCQARSVCVGSWVRLSAIRLHSVEDTADWTPDLEFEP